MSPERWQQIERLYNAARGRSEEEQAKFLAEECAADGELRREVEWMLAHQKDTESFIRQPVGAIAAEMFGPDAARSLDGSVLGPYQELKLIGKGGMGEVYKGLDTRLHRFVAIKVLPDHISHDPQLKQRFRREAQTLARLSHPHICPVFDIGEQDGVQYLVMEFLEGQTLGERLQKGALSRVEALKIGVDLADALDKAHSHDVIHRDIKPSNVMLTKTGAKLLDFGLAKLQVRPFPTLSSSGTNTSVSAPGTIVGTPQYMAPEQLEGKECDARSDIFCLGLILYEMSTGTKAFTGDSQAALIADIMKCKPAPMEKVDDHLRHVIERCLARDPDDRWQNAKDLRGELMWTGQLAPDRGVPQQQVVPLRFERAAWVSIIAILSLVAVALGIRGFRSYAPPPEVRFEIDTPPTGDFISIAISPDGQKIVYAGASADGMRLWLRSLNSITAEPLAGTDGGSLPFWSPDNKSIGFFADSKLKTLELQTGLLGTIADVTYPYGGAWTPDGTILFAPNAAGPIFQVSATAGGKPEPLTRIEGLQSSHEFPQLLPDGRHFLLYVLGNPRGIYIGQFGASTIQRLPIDTDSQGVYTSGHILFINQRTLFAQDFDATKLLLSGTPVPIAQQIVIDSFNIAALSASAAGPIIYRAGSTGGQRQFVWLDRNGKEIEKVGDPDDAGPQVPSLSPDGQRVTVNRTVNGNIDLWMFDVTRGLPRPVTSAATSEGAAIWSPDGTRIVFTSNRNGAYDLYTKPTTGIGSEDLLVLNPENKAAGKAPVDWSPDGRYILYRSASPSTGFDLWAKPFKGEGKEFPVVQTPQDDRDGQFSPDGNWIAYQTTEASRFEIFIQQFPSGERFRVSPNGGAQVRWRHDGKELFYVAMDGRLMAVPIEYSSDGKTPKPLAPVPLFPTHIGGALAPRQQYMVSRDGQRFLMNTLVSETETSPIAVVLNWTDRK